MLWHIAIASVFRNEVLLLKNMKQNHMFAYPDALHIVKSFTKGQM